VLNHHVSPVEHNLPSVVEHVRQKLEKAVCSHLVSDVPVGVFLSGGIDSSAITAFASRHYNGRLKTYSVDFDFDPQVSELSKAKEVADYFGTDHNELHISCRDVSAVIESLVKHHDEPFGDPANIPLYLLCEELKGSVKVILQGDGGDEMFGGYRRYSVLYYERLWRTLAAVVCSLKPTLKLFHSARYFRYMRFFEALAQSQSYMRMALLMTEESINNAPTRVLSKDLCTRVAKIDPFEKYHDWAERFPDLKPVQKMLYTDANIILPDVFLEKVDRATMAHGIEVRVPMLDVDLAEYVMGVPSTLKVNRGRKKWLLRKSLRGVVPDKILDAPKRGFGVPVSTWLRGPLKGFMKSILLDSQVTQSGFYDAEQLARCINDHIDGRKNNGPLLYKLINFSLWHQHYFSR
jgi:asparagine synthase (glutamine-hydrolysing)